MRYKALRELLAHSPRIETGYAESVRVFLSELEVK